MPSFEDDAIDARELLRGLTGSWSTPFWTRNRPAVRRRSKSPQRHHKGSFSICTGALTFHIAKLCFGSFARFQSVLCEEKHFLAEATSMLNLAI